MKTRKGINRLNRQIENDWDNPEFRKGYLEAEQELDRLMGRTKPNPVVIQLEKERLKNDPEAEVQLNLAENSYSMKSRKNKRGELKSPDLRENNIPEEIHLQAGELAKALFRLPPKPQAEIKRKKIKS